MIAINVSKMKLFAGLTPISVMMLDMHSLSLLEQIILMLPRVAERKTSAMNSVVIM